MTYNKDDIKTNIILFNSLESIKSTQIQRIALLNKYYEKKYEIVTLEPDYLFYDNRPKIEELSCTKCINFYFQLRNKKFENNNTQHQNEIDIKKISYTTKHNKKINGVVRLVEYLNDDGKLVQIDRLDYEGILFSRTISWSDERTYEYFFKKDGSHYLVIEKEYSNIETTELNEITISVLNSEGKVIKTFTNEGSFISYYLSSMLIHKDSAVIMEEIEVYKKIEELEGDNLFKLYYMNQKIENCNWMKEINPAQLDALIFSTDLQKQSTISKLGNRTNYFTLSTFFHDEPKQLTPFVYHEDNSYIIKASQENDPYIEHVLRAMRIALDKGLTSTINLKIFGIEALGISTENLINDLGLSKFIEFKGLISNQEAYRESNFSINLNSQNNEGVEILESIHYGCPVIAYDSNYIVKELSDDNTNLILIKNNSIIELAKIFSFEEDNLEEIVVMRQNAFKMIEKYNPENFMLQWHNINNRVIQNKPKRSKLDYSSITLLNLGWMEESTFYIKAQLKLFGQLINKEQMNIYFILQNRKTKDSEILVTKITEYDTNNYQLYAEIDFKTFNFDPSIWDLYSVFECENNYFKNRIGNQENHFIKDDMETRVVNHRVIKPYFTKKGNNNVSFKVSRYMYKNE